MAILKLNDTTVFTETSGTASISDNVQFPAGHVVQVLQSVKSDTDSTRKGFGSGFDDITGTDQNGSGNIFCVKITPKYNTSKIMITASINACLLYTSPSPRDRG